MKWMMCLTPSSFSAFQGLSGFLFKPKTFTLKTVAGFWSLIFLDGNIHSWALTCNNCKTHGDHSQESDLQKDSFDPVRVEKVLRCTGKVEV